MEPLHTWKDYLNYKTLLKHINDLIKYYDRYNDDVHNRIGEIQTAKRELLRTKYKTLTGLKGAKISINNATNQQINMAFKNAFSKKGVKMEHYLKTITKPWYEVRIKNFEDRIRKISPIAPLEQIIAAKQLAIRDNNHARADGLHKTIEQRLNQCSKKELKQIWDAYRPHIHPLMEYAAFKDQLR